MATTVLDLKAVLGLDSSEYDKGLANAKSSASSLGSGVAKAASLGLKAVGAATTAMVGFGATSVRTGLSFDSSMSQVAATMGKTTEEISDLRDFAQEMGRTTAFSATQAADALNYMALAGYDSETSMQMLPNVLNLAAAGNMDLARASDMVTDTQTAFGMSLERTSQMVDEMAKAASTGNTSVEQLGDAFLTVGGLAQELNGGFVTLADGTQKPVDGVQELEIALTAMANSGIKGSEAGTHMRNMLLKLSSPTDDGTKALEAMGVAVFDTEGNMRSLSEVFGDLSTAMSDMTQQEKMEVISDLFNTRDLASAEALLGAVSQDWDKIGESILNAEGAASAMAGTQLDNLAGAMTLFKSALEGAQIAISDVLSPVLKDFVAFGTEGLSTLTAAFQEGGLTGAMEAFGTILADGLNMVIEKLPSMVDAGMQLLGALGQGILDNLPVIIDAAIKIINQLVKGLVQALPALVDGALQIVVGLANGITEMLPELIPAIIEVVLKIVDVLIENAPLLLDAGLQLLMGLAQGLIDALPTLIEKLPAVIQGIVDFLIDAIPMLIDAAMQLTMAVVDALPEIITAIVDALPQIITAVVNGLMEGLPMIIEGLVQLQIAIVEHLPEIIAALIEAIPMIIQSIIEIIVASVPQWLSAVQSILSSIGSLVGASFNVFMTNVGTFFSNLLTTVVTWLKQLPVKAAYFAGQFVAQYISFMRSLPSKLMQILNAVISNVVSFGTKFVAQGLKIAKDFKEKLINGVKEIPSKMLEIGQNIVEGLKEGISKSWTAFTDWIADLGKNLVKGFKENLKIKSPSKVFADEVGRWIPAGIAEGIKDNAYLMYDAIGDLSLNAVSVPNPLKSSLDSIVGSIGPAAGNQQINVYVTLEGDAKRMFRVMQSEATSNYRLTGNAGMVTA